MSEIHNNEGLALSGNQHQGEQHNQQSREVSFKGEKTDLRYDPGASVKRMWVNKAKAGSHTITFGSKEVRQVQKDLEVLNENPASVQRAIALYPAFLGYAEKKGLQNPEALALALQHYTATNEFIRDVELEQQSK